MTSDVEYVGRTDIDIVYEGTCLTLYIETHSLVVGIRSIVKHYIG